MDYIGRITTKTYVVAAALHLMEILTVPFLITNEQLAEDQKNDMKLQ